MNQENILHDNASSMEESDGENESHLSFSISTQNRFEGRQNEEPNRKRKKGSSGSMQFDSFTNKNTDDKLNIIYDQLTKNYEKIQAIETSQSKCISDIYNVNKGYITTKHKLDKIEELCDVHTQTLRRLTYHSIDQEARSRRNNIIFYGITENTRYNDRDIILMFMCDELNIDTSQMCIERAHRLGTLHSPTNRSKNDPKRPLIVKFRDYIDTDTVMERAYRLRGSVFGIDRDYPREIANARKQLYNSDEAKSARVNREKVQIKYPARLFIKGKMVKDKLPDWFSMLRGDRLLTATVGSIKQHRGYSDETLVDDNGINLIDLSVETDEVFVPRLRPESVHTGNAPVLDDININKLSRDTVTGQAGKKENKKQLPENKSKSHSRSRNREKSANMNSENSQNKFISGNSDTGAPVRRNARDRSQSPSINRRWKDQKQKSADRETIRATQ